MSSDDAPLDLSCDSNADCDDACISGSCTLLSPALGECDEAGDCEGGASCGGDVCLGDDGYMCSDNIQCTAVCRVGVCGSLGAVSEGCDEEVDCSAGLVCATGVCLSPIGGSCSGPGDCATSLCVADSCAADPSTLSYCEDISHCPANHDCVDNRCLLDSGESCANDEECSEQCVASTCAPRGNEGDACDDAQDCVVGLVCNSLICETAPDPLAVLNDEFDDPSSLANWTARHTLEGEGSASGASSITGGHLILQPNDSTYFYNTNRGLSLHKAIDRTQTPNFLLEVEVGAYARGTLDPPGANFFFAGVVVFSDISNPGTWTLNSVGRFSSGTIGVESKDTVANVSTSFVYDSEGQNRVKLRACVVGTELSLYSQLIGETEWVERDAYTMTPADEIQIGPMASQYISPSEDIDGVFDYARFRTVASKADCAAP